MTGFPAGPAGALPVGYSRRGRLLIRWRLFAVVGLIFGMALLTCSPSAAAAATAWVAPLPVPLHVLNGFAPPSSPYGAGNRGVDLVAAQGEAVRSAGDGVVGYAGLVGGKRVVTVSHAGGLRTTYEPVAATVRAGEHVVAGAVIGTIRGIRPQCAVSCLHWGLLRGDVYLDPMSLLAGPVRLLPLTGVPVQQPDANARWARPPVTATPIVDHRRATGTGPVGHRLRQRAAAVATGGAVTGGAAIGGSVGWAALRRRWARRRT